MNRLVAILPMLVVACALPAVAAPERDSCSVRVTPGDDVQAAVERVAPARGTVCLAPGEYRLPRFLSIVHDGVRLRGAGEATVLRLAEGLQSPVIVVGDHRERVPARPVADVVIERLRVIGGGAGGSEHLADFPHVTNSAIVIRTGHAVVLRALDVSACRSACVVTEHDTRDVTIEDGRFGPAAWDGLSFNRTRGVRVVGSTIHDNTAAGITAEHLEDGLLERNLVRHNGSHGVYLADSHRNRFRENRVADNVNAGVFLTCAVRERESGGVRCWDDSMSQGNTFEGNVFAGNRRTFIVAADAAANCLAPGRVPNVSRGDRFVDDPGLDQNAAAFGPCLVVSPPRPGVE